MINFSNLYSAGTSIEFDLDSDDLSTFQFDMGSLTYLTAVEAVPDRKNPEYIYMEEKGGNYILHVDKEKAEGGSYIFGIDIQNEDGSLAKRIDLTVSLTTKEDEIKKEEDDDSSQEVEETDEADDEANESN